MSSITYLGIITTPHPYHDTCGSDSFEEAAEFVKDAFLGEVAKITTGEDGTVQRIQWTSSAPVDLENPSWVDFGELKLQFNSAIAAHYKVGSEMQYPA